MTIQSAFKLGQGRIVDLTDLQSEEEERGPEDIAEQNLEEESVAMLQSWDAPLPKPNDLLARDINVDPNIYYDGETSFDEIKAGMESLEGGKVWVKVLESNPDGAAITLNSSIVYDIAGFLEYNPILIESSIQDGKPKVLSLSEGPAVPGMLKALITLHQGERANIIIHPAMAYGRCGAPPLIPKDSYLFYSVKIYKVFEDSDLDAAFRYEKSHLQLIDLPEKIRIMREHKDLANKYLREDQPREALIRYKAAIKWAKEEDEEVKESDKEWRDLLEVLYQNAAITYNKLDMPKAASKSAKMTLSINPDNIKAYFQLSKARLAVGDNHGALRAVEKAHALDKQNSSVNNLRLQIDAVFREEKKERDEILKKMSRAYV